MIGALSVAQWRSSVAHYRAWTSYAGLWRCMGQWAVDSGRMGFKGGVGVWVGLGYGFWGRVQGQNMQVISWHGMGLTWGVGM